MRRIQQIIVLLSVVATITINALANILPINGKNTGELSDAIPIYFVPEGYVFSIWSLIYVGLIVYALYQFTKKGTRDKKLQSIGWLFVVNMIANSTWIFLWHYELVPVSVLAMLVILITLIVIYNKLEIGIKKVNAGTFWMSHVPFSLYLGWISVATIANIAGALFVLGWEGAPLEGATWSAIMIIVATLLALVMLFQRKDVIFVLVVVWAVIGIGLKFSDVSIIVSASIASISILGLGVAYKLLKQKK